MKKFGQKYNAINKFELNILHDHFSADIIKKLGNYYYTTLKGGNWAVNIFFKSTTRLLKSHFVNHPKV